MGNIQPTGISMGQQGSLSFSSTFRRPIDKGQVKIKYPLSPYWVMEAPPLLKSGRGAATRAMAAIAINSTNPAKIARSVLLWAGRFRAKRAKRRDDFGRIFYPINIFKIFIRMVSFPGRGVFKETTPYGTADSARATAFSSFKISTFNKPAGEVFRKRHRAITPFP